MTDDAHNLTDAEREEVRRMAYAGSYSREKADRYVATVESILAARLAEAEQAAEPRGAERVLAERDALAQAMWDAYVVLGFDPDGGTSPGAWIAGARSYRRFCKQWLAEMRQVRRDYDELLDESSRTEAALAELLAAVEALADEWERYTEEGGNGRHGFRAYEYGGEHVVGDLRALVAQQRDGGGSE